MKIIIFFVVNNVGNRRGYRDRYNTDRDQRFETRNESPSSPYSEERSYFDRPEPILNFVRGPSDRYRDAVSFLYMRGLECFFIPLFHLDKTV